MENISKPATQRSVVIFSKSSCRMSYAVERLFRELGVNPTIHELDTIPNGKEIEKALTRFVGSNRPVPAVFSPRYRVPCAAATRGGGHLDDQELKGHMHETAI